MSLHYHRDAGHRTISFQVDKKTYARIEQQAKQEQQSVRAYARGIMTKKNDPGADAAAVESACSSDSDQLSRVVPIQWTDSDGTVFESDARQWMTINDLIAMLERVQPHNRTIPLRFSIRFNPGVPHSIPLSLVTRKRLEHDTVAGDKAVFLRPDKTLCGLNFIFSDDAPRYALAVSTAIENEDQPLSEASPTVPSAAPKD